LELRRNGAGLFNILPSILPISTTSCVNSYTIALIDILNRRKRSKTKDEGKRRKAFFYWGLPPLLPFVASFRNEYEFHKIPITPKPYDILHKSGPRPHPQ
jgi:hypothetical protein